MSFLFGKKNNQKPDPEHLPAHIGIIMDGNGRWAQKRGLPRTAGHAAGVKTFKNISLYAQEIGIRQITFYAFSTENWKRPKQEIDRIMQLLDQYIEEGLAEYAERKARIRFVGDLAPIPPKMAEKIRRLEALTKDYTGWTLNIALNYGGRAEIVNAAQKIAREAVEGTLAPEEISENTIASRLYYDDMSECDLIIRPSGEYRLSNFLLWQSAYSEFWFDKILWPDFKPEDLDRAICDFQKRQRRFGAI